MGKNQAHPSSDCDHNTLNYWSKREGRKRKILTASSVCTLWFLWFGSLTGVVYYEIFYPSWSDFLCVNLSETGKYSGRLGLRLNIFFCTITLPVVLLKGWFWCWGNKVEWRVENIWASDLKDIKYQEDGESCIMRSFIICVHLSHFVLINLEWWISRWM
jgi:hypothetical protein